MPQHFSQLHGYAGPHALALGGVTVDPEERFHATHTAYAIPASTAQSSPVAVFDPLLVRMGDLKRTLRQVQGMDYQSYQFRDLC